MRGGRSAGLSAVSRLASEKHAAQLHSLLFQPVEQSPRPDEFRGQQAERKQDRQPAGAGGHDHDDSDRKQSEPEENLQEPLRLLERLNQQTVTIHGRYAIYRQFGAPL